MLSADTAPALESIATVSVGLLCRAMQSLYLSS